jgi:predicted secreted protein
MNSGVVLKIAKSFVLLVTASTWAGMAFSDGSQANLPNQRVNLSASASVPVAQDMLTMSLSTLREGPDAQGVQAQLKTALEAALSLARREARSGQMEVRTGRFSVSPRYGRDGKPGGWQGSAELLLEGQDVVRISETAGKIQTMTVSGVSWGLTPAQRQLVQAQAQAQVVAQFRQRASELAKAFEFSGYTLGEVSVNYDDAAPPGRPLMMAERASASATPVPVEAGQSLVTVTVTGSVQLK